MAVKMESITNDEVKHTVSKMKLNRACGMDDTPPAFRQTVLADNACGADEWYTFASNAGENPQCQMHGM